ncbi:uncharacterized protein F5147DRAFT_647201 [Suillus discolor]|uniref:Uncharacterized protein n=1 Tax=Suillus discolor TaxID=1912936 RepID=A0A9P7FM60_9AGAM|nr:uncharacterized protein F5147DRAFT_647201 [Suillus discolor]KAG2120774.1 hypothetical protein F5147DRAFT_647201 [Suillus discolor]
MPPESDSEYEKAHGKKRKLKFVNTSHTSKKPAPSNKKAAWPKQPKMPGLPISATSPMKGGPLSPLTVGSSSVAASLEPETAATAPAFLQDGPSNIHTKVKACPITKEFKDEMKQALCMVYRHSDGLKLMRKDLPSEVMQDDRPAGDQESPQLMLQPTHPKLIMSSLSIVTLARVFSEALMKVSSETLMRVTLYTTHRNLNVRLSTTIAMILMRPLRSHSHEPWYMHEAVHHCEVHHSHEDTPITERDALYPCNAFYHHDSHNYHHAGLQPHNNYGPEPHANSEFAMYTMMTIMLTMSVNAHTQVNIVQDLVLTMLVRVDTLNMMTLMNSRHLVEELTVTMGTLKAELVTKFQMDRSCP